MNWSIDGRRYIVVYNNFKKRSKTTLHKIFLKNNYITIIHQLVYNMSALIHLRLTLRLFTPVFLYTTRGIFFYLCFDWKVCHIIQGEGMNGFDNRSTINRRVRGKIEKRKFFINYLVQLYNYARSQWMQKHYGILVIFSRFQAIY